MQKFLEKNYKKLIFVILGFMLVVSVLNAWNDSAIFDETAHIGAGYSYVTQNEMRLNPEHPPLIKDLAGLPLLFLDLNFNVDQPFWTGELPRKWDEGQWAAGRNLLYESGNDADQILFWSRIPIILLSLILGWFIFYWTRRLAGTMAGLFALTLYAFDPNILGHNHFVTTDLGIAVAFVFSFYFYIKFIENPSWKNVFLNGLFLGILQLTKFSFIIVLPILALITLVYPLTKIVRDSKKSIWQFRFKKLAEYIWKGFLALLISLVIVWIVYFFNTFRMSQEVVKQGLDFNFPPEQTHNIKEVYTRKILHAFNENLLTRPLAIYGEGIGYVFKRVAGGNGAYFMGEVSSTAFPAYFPTVFLLKEPLVSLSLIFLALLLSLSSGIRFIFQRLFFHFGQSSKKLSGSWNILSFIRQNITSLSMAAFIFLYSYVSVTGNLNIGFRHLFPILPFIYILTAKVIFDFIKKLDVSTRQIWKIVLLILSVFLVAGTISAYPFYMSYFNQAGGGPKNGYRLVTDSNADWGQDLKRFRKWIVDYNENKNEEACELIKYNLDGECAPIEKIRLNYFGGGDIFYYFDDTVINWWDSRRPLEAGWYAISTNYLMGSLYDQAKPDDQSYRWTKKLEPVAQVGTSILIYHLTPEEAAALN